MSYTYAKALGDSSSNGGDLANWQNLYYNYGELNIDRRHAFVATVVYQLPTFAGKNIFLREAAGGLQITAVARVQSGPYQPIQGAAKTLGTRRAAYLGGSMYLKDDRHTLPNHQAQWLNPAAFTLAPPDSFGNAGVGSVILPGLEQGDVTLSKIFYLPREAQFKLQADAFNVLNKTNYSGLDSNSTNPGFGRLNGAYPPRQMQFGAKIIF